MKPLISALLLFAFRGHAQVVFELPTAIATWGVQDQELWVAPDDTSIAVSGTGVVWDLTYLTYATDLNMTVAPPASTPYATDFPLATHAVGEVYAGGSDTSWQYFQLSGDSLFINGMTFPPPPHLCAQRYATGHLRGRPPGGGHRDHSLSRWHHLRCGLGAAVVGRGRSR
jgi:hypothetical protein